MKKTLIILTAICMVFAWTPPVMADPLFQSQPKGIQVGNTGLNLDSPGDNLFWGLINNSSVAGSSFLKFQTYDGGYTERFRVDRDGNVTASSGYCIGGSCITSWSQAGGSLPSGTSGQTLRHNGTNWVANSNIVNNGSNVGIGNSSPGYKLDVAGDIRSQGNILTNSNYGKGLIGLYSSIRYQGVFSMGAAYLLAADGATPGNLYGIAWTHQNIGGQSKSGLHHQALFMENGETQTAIGRGVWTIGNVDAAEIYSRGWLRNNNANTGLYNQATAKHFYSQDANYWAMISNRGMVLRSGHAGTITGYLYWSGTAGSNNFGLLSPDGSWKVRTDNSGVELYNTVRINSTASIRQNSSTWTGNPGAGQGKLEYHSNRWYVVGGSDSTEIVRFRRDGTDVSTINNSGAYTGDLSGWVNNAKLNQTSSYSHFLNWIQFSSNDHGLYWSNNGWHVYPANSAGMRMRSGSASEVALRMETNETVRGYVYADWNNNVGILNASGHWVMRTVGNSTNITFPGNVGIGTTQPNTLLSFGSTDRGETINIYDPLTQANRTGWGKYTNESRMYIPSGDRFTWRGGGSNGTELMRITGTGNVGIGTNNPSFKLHVQGSGSLLSTSNYFNMFTSSGSSGQGMILGYNTEYGGGGMIAGDGIGGRVNSLVFIGYNGSAWGERMRLLGNGNLGIGTADPGSYRLRVEGNANIVGSGGCLGYQCAITLGPNNGTQIAYCDSCAANGLVALPTLVVKDGLRTPNIYVTDYSAYLVPGSVNGNYWQSSGNNIYRDVGNVGIGLTPTWRLQVRGQGTTSSTYSLVVEKSTGYNNFWIRDDGAGWLAGSLAQNSDKRLKENISYIQSGLNFIDQLRPIKFDFIEGEKKQVGFIAQEVQKVLPDIVSEGMDGMLGINNNGIIPYLVKGMQEQQQQIEELKAEIEKLKKN